MNNKFDELTTSMAQSVTRRAALKKFGVGLAGMALACLGLANKAGAATHAGYCVATATALENNGYVLLGYCQDTTTCQMVASSQCRGNVKKKNIVRNVRSAEFSVAVAVVNHVVGRSVQIWGLMEAISEICGCSARGLE
jgi:hypothetical protein